jgi:hypothetical protein
MVALLTPRLATVRVTRLLRFGVIDHARAFPA